jgi:hypothetical protein
MGVARSERNGMIDGASRDDSPKTGGGADPSLDDRGLAGESRARTATSAASAVIATRPN